MALLENERFQIRRRLGIGGMGEVYEALDHETREIVALKTLYQADFKNIERFKKEFFSLKDLAHPNLVKLNEFFEENDQWYFSMELVEGRDFLTSVRPSPQEFDETRLRNYLGQLALGISALHENGKVHRDIKPSNIIVTDDDRVVILDFGLVTDVIAGRQLGDISAVGTAAYMSPEQSVGMPVGAAVDWYSVGVLLYQSLTGRLPYDGSMYKIRIDRQMSEPKPPSEYCPHAPTDLVELCVDLLRYDPGARPSGRQVLERLGVESSRTRKSGFVADGAERYEDSVPFVGRANELGALRAAFDFHRMGHDVSVIILGEPGLGKTALAHEFLSQSQKKPENENLIVLSGRCKKNTALPFQAFDAIVSGLSDHLHDILATVQNNAELEERTSVDPFLTPEEASAIVKVFPSLRRVRAIVDSAKIRKEKPSPGRTRAHAFRALRKLIRFTATHCPLMLFIDDLQWARDDSLDLLKEVMFVDELSPLFLLTTMRAESTLHRNTEEILPNVKRLFLERLSSEDSTELARTLCAVYDNSCPQDKLKVLVQEAEGHPLFLAELVRHMIVEGNIAANRLEDVLWSRVQTLSKDAQHVLELISLAGVALDYETLADAAEMTPEDCIRGVSHLLAQKLVRSSGLFEDETLEPYHDRVHETVIPHISPETKRKYHRRLAYAIGVEAKGVDQAVVVGHLEAGGLTKDAARIAERAALKASNSLAFGQAVDLLRTALRAGEHDDNHQRKLLMELGDALCNIGRGADASKAYLDARHGADMATRFNLWRQAAEQLIVGGHLKEGLEELGQLLAETGEGFSKTPKRTLISLLWKRLLLKIRGLRWKERPEEIIDSNELARLDVYQVVTENLAMVNNIMGADYQARRLLTALRLGEKKRIGDAISLEAIYIASQGTRRAFRQAARLILLSKKIAVKYSILNLIVMIDGVTGIVRYCQGLLNESSQLLLKAEEELRSRAHGSNFQLNNTRLFRMRVLRIMGDFNQLRESAERYIRDATRRGDKYMETNMRYLRSSTWLAWDMKKEARRDLAEVRWTPPEDEYHMQHWYETLARAEISLYEGTVEENIDYFNGAFRALTKSLLLRMGIYRAEYWWLKGRILLAMSTSSSPKQAKKLLNSARRLAKKLTISKTGFRPAEVWALLLHATISHQEGKREAAALSLKRAVQKAEETECYQIAASARRRLGQILGDPEGGDIKTLGDDWMKTNGIVDLESMTQVFLPGFFEK